MTVVFTGTRGIPGIMGGVETHCEELCPRLAALGVDVTVVRRTAYVHDTLTEWKGVKLKDIPAPKKKSLEAVIHTFKAVNYAARIKADILHVHAAGPALVTPYAKMRGMKVVFTSHGPEYDRDKWGPLAKAVLKLGERLAVRHADDVIAISQPIKDMIADKYGRTERVHLIPNGVPAPSPCGFPEYFEELGIEPGRYILGLCRFVPEKRLEDLVEACKGLEGYRLVLAGDTDFDDDYSRRLKALARESGAVLTGFVRGRKLHSLLSHAACYALPSSYEGLPIALLEAMSYGRKVVVSDIAANLEVGLPGECYFHCGDVAELRTKIEAQLHTETEPHYDMTRYDWDQIAGQVKQVYESQDI
ncbi:MAG: glycosyltransferase family 4 protein [Bacteroidales bacterium]|nr:glycosyltransferase family 4 protein [Bacteroidales bacterium]